MIYKETVKTRDAVFLLLNEQIQFISETNFQLIRKCNILLRFRGNFAHLLEEIWHTEKQGTVQSALLSQLLILLKALQY